MYTNNFLHIIETVPTPLLLQVADLKNLMLTSYLDNANYTTPSDANLRLAESLFEKLLIVRDFSSHEVEAWSNLGLVLQVAYDAFGQRFAVVSEAIRQGHGFYTVKLGEVTPFERLKFLQAPHRPSDTYTHEIVYDMLTLSHVFGAAGWSTTHRNVIDLCKEPKSYFNSFTTAIAKAIATPTIVQVHGFAKELRDVDVDVVFSSTKASMSPAFHPIADCIEEGLSPWILLRYPDEVDFLGGTLNINAQLFYEQSGTGKFVHFETSKELRDELRINGTLKLTISECF